MIATADDESEQVYKAWGPPSGRADPRSPAELVQRIQLGVTAEISTRQKGDREPAEPAAARERGACDEESGNKLSSKNIARSCSQGFDEGQCGGEASPNPFSSVSLVALVALVALIVIGVAIISAL